MDALGVRRQLGIDMNETELQGGTVYARSQQQDQLLADLGMQPSLERQRNNTLGPLAPASLTEERYAQSLEPRTPFEYARGAGGMVAVPDGVGGPESFLESATSVGASAGQTAMAVGKALWESHKFWEKDITAGQRAWRAANTASLFLPFAVGSKAMAAGLTWLFPAAKGLVLGNKGRIALSAVAEASVAGGLEVINPEGHSGSVGMSMLIGAAIGGGGGALIGRADKAARRAASDGVLTRLSSEANVEEALRSDSWAILGVADAPGQSVRATQEVSEWKIWNAMDDADRALVPEPGLKVFERLSARTAVLMDNLIENGFKPVAASLPDGSDGVMIPGLPMHDAAAVASELGQRKFMTNAGEVDLELGVLRPTAGHNLGRAVEADDLAFSFQRVGADDGKTLQPFTTRLSDETIDLGSGRSVSLGDADQIFDQQTLSQRTWGWFADLDSRPAISWAYGRTLNGYHGAYLYDQVANPGMRARSRTGVSGRGVEDVLDGSVITTDNGIQKMMQLFQGKATGYVETALRTGIRVWDDVAEPVAERIGETSEALFSILGRVPNAERPDLEYLGFLKKMEAAAARGKPVSPRILDPKLKPKADRQIDFGRLMKEVPVENAPIGTRADGTVRGGRRTPDGRVQIDEAHLRATFPDAPWTKPKVPGVQPLPRNAFRTEDEWLDFARAHEAMHEKVRPEAMGLDTSTAKGKADYENWTNNAALDLVRGQAVRLPGSGRIGMTEAEQVARRIDAMRQKMGEPAFDRLLQTVRQSASHRAAFKRQTLVRTGILPETGLESMKDANPFDVPAARVRAKTTKTFDDADLSVLEADTRLEVVDPVNRLATEVSEADKYVPWTEQIVHEQAAMSRMAGQQEVYNRLAEDVMADPDAFAHLVTIKKGRNWGPTDAPGSRPKQLDVGLPDGSTIEASSFIDPKGNFFVKGYLGGNHEKPVWMQLGSGNKAQALKDALEMMGPQQTSWAVRMLGQVARAQRTGVVLDPTFGGKSVLRDLPFAFVQAGLNPLAFVEGTAALLSHSKLGGALGLGETEMAEWVVRWKASGGTKSALASMDRNAIRQLVERGVPAGSTGEAVRRAVVRNPLDYFAALSETMENATRVGTFRRRANRLLAEAKEKGVQIDPQTVLNEAAIASREVSVDFQVRGASPLMSSLRISTAFFGAALQGGDQLRRALVNDPQGVMSRMALGITFPSVMLYMHNRRDPEYEQLSDEEKNLYWHVKRPAGMLGDDADDQNDDVWLRFPKPFEPGLLAGSMPEHFLRFIDSEDPKALDEAAGSIMHSLRQGFTPMPSAMQPLLEQWTNIDSYTGSPIVPEGMEDVDPAFHGGSGFAQGLAGMLNQGDPSTFISPLQIDNMVRGYTGGLGAGFTSAGDLAVESVRRIRGEPNPSEPVERELIEVLPVTRALVSPFPTGGQPLKDAYSYADQMREAVRTIQYLEDSMAVDDLVDYSMKNALEAGLGATTEKMVQDIANLRQQRAQVVSAPGMSGADKRRLIRTIDRSVMRYAESVNSVLKDMGLRPDGANAPMLRAFRDLIGGPGVSN